MEYCRGSPEAEPVPPLLVGDDDVRSCPWGHAGTAADHLTGRAPVDGGESRSDCAGWSTRPAAVRSNPPIRYPTLIGCFFAIAYSFAGSCASVFISALIRR